MSSTKISQDVRSLLLARPTQLMLTDAIIGLVAKGVYLSAKYNVLSVSDRDRFLSELENIVGADDITEAVQPLRFRYEFVNKFGDIKYGQMPQLIRATSDQAASNRAARSELLLLKDYSFTYRELAPLFEMLREARNYYAHNTCDREDIGWNALIISAVTRILERGNFLDKKRVEERAELRQRTTLLFDKLVNSHAEPSAATLTEERDEPSNQQPEETDSGVSAELLAIVESVSSNQAELLSNSRSMESRLSSLSQQIEALRLSTEPGIAELSNQVVTNDSASKIVAPEQSRAGGDDGPAGSNTQDERSEEGPVLASETLLSVDMLYEELQKLKGHIKAEYESDGRWRGPASNLLQRAIITTIVTNEPDSMKEVLKYDDVKWRIRKEKDLLNEQAKKFGALIDELLTRTAWSKDYQ